MEKIKAVATLEEDVLTSVIERLQLQNAKLQEYVDKEGEACLHKFVSSIGDAMQLADTYDDVWFKNCLYSDDLKRKIALHFINQTKSYPVDSTIWQFVAANPQQDKDAR